MKEVFHSVGRTNNRSIFWGKFEEKCSFEPSNAHVTPRMEGMTFAEV
jgi:hypothetical protein